MERGTIIALRARALGSSPVALGPHEAAPLDAVEQDRQSRAAQQRCHHLHMAKRAVMLSGKDIHDNWASVLGAEAETQNILLRQQT